MLSWQSAERMRAGLSGVEGFAQAVRKVDSYLQAARALFVNLDSPTIHFG